MWWLGLIIALIFGFILGVLVWEGYNSDPFQSFLNQLLHPQLKGATVQINSTLNSIKIEKVRIDSLETVIPDGTTFNSTPETARENAIFLIITLNMTNIDTHPVSIQNSTSNWKLYSGDDYYELGTTDIPTENDSLQLKIPSKISVLHKVGFEVPMNELMKFTLEITEPPPKPKTEDEADSDSDSGAGTKGTETKGTETKGTETKGTETKGTETSEITSDSKPTLNSTRIEFNASTDEIVKEPIIKPITHKNKPGIYADDKLKIEILNSAWSFKDNSTQSSFQDLLTNYNSYLGSILITKDNSTGVSIFVFEKKNPIKPISNLIDWELKMMNKTDITKLSWSTKKDNSTGKLILTSDTLHTEETQYLLKTVDRIYSIHYLVNTTKPIDQEYQQELHDLIKNDLTLIQLP